MSAHAWRRLELVGVARSEIAAVTVVLLLTALAGRELFAAPLPSGHDAVYYLPRHIEFYRALTDGVPVPRWAPDLAGGFGQPLFNFTPPLFYYLTAGIHALGVGLAAAGSFAALVLLALAGLSMYLLAREFYGRAGGLIAAAGYIFAPYLLVDLYVRYAMGDFAAFAFVPLAFWGTVRFAMAPSPLGLITGAAGVATLVLSSNHVALMTLPTLALVVAIVASSRRRWSVCFRGAACMALGLGASAFFWFPALVERPYVSIDRAIRGVYDYTFHFVYPQQLLFSPWGYGGSVAGPDDGFSLSLGVPQLGLAALAVVSLPIVWKKAPRAALALLTAAVVLMLSAFFSTDASRPLWSALPLLQYLQFPWRFLSLATVALAFLAGATATFLPRLGRWGVLATVLTVGVLVVQGAPNAVAAARDYDLPENFAPEDVAAWGLVGSNASEFEPIWVQRRRSSPATVPLEVVSGNARWQPLHLTSIVREFAVMADGPARLRATTFYFPGWRLKVDGEERPIDFTNPEGAMEFDVAAGNHAVLLEFEDTPVRRWATFLSFASGALVLGVSAALARR